MFHHKKNKSDPNLTDTVIGKESVFEGNIKSKASIHIDGKVHGDIECEGDCTIGEEGVAFSNIRARNVSIAGKVEGNISAKEKLIIVSSGQLDGNIESGVLIIEEGGRFNGHSSMVKKEEKPIEPTATKKEAG